MLVLIICINEANSMNSTTNGNWSTPSLSCVVQQCIMYVASVDLVVIMYQYILILKSELQQTK